MPAELLIHPQTLPLDTVWDNPLARDLLRGVPEVQAFYRYRLGADELQRAIADRAAQPWRAPAGELAQALRAYHERFGVTPAQDANLLRLARPDAVVVVGGQQPGLFGGPLYTLYKALTLVGEAERLRAQGLEAVPVFWSATEDDDFEEIRTAWLLDPEDEPRSVSLAMEQRGGQSVGSLILPETVAAGLLETVAAYLPDTEFRDPLLARLGECWRGGATLGDAFAGWLMSLLGERGLLVLDPMQPALRALAAPLLRRVLTDPLEPTRLANQVGEQLDALGYPVPTHRPERLCAFYVYAQGIRHRLWHDGDALLGGSGERFELTALRERLTAEPERFSTSVLLRPVVQDYLLPTALFVVGPGEVAYNAQLGPIYDWLDVARPLLLPRYSASVVEPKVGRHLAAYQLDVPDAWHELSVLLPRVARDVEGQATSEAFAQTLAALEPPLAALEAHVEAIDESLARAAESMANRFRMELGKLEQKAQRALRQQNETLQRRLEVIHAHLYPGNALQERRLSAVGLLAKFGPGLTEALESALTQAGSGVHVTARIEP